MILHRPNSSFLSHKLLLILFFHVSFVIGTNTSSWFLDTNHRESPKHLELFIWHCTWHSLFHNIYLLFLSWHKTNLICSCHCIHLIATSPHARTDRNSESGWLRKLRKTNKPSIQSDPWPLTINLPIHLFKLRRPRLYERTYEIADCNSKSVWLQKLRKIRHPFIWSTLTCWPIIAAASSCGWRQRLCYGWAFAHRLGLTRPDLYPDPTYNRLMGF